MFNRSMIASARTIALRVPGLDHFTGTPAQTAPVA